MNPNATFVHAVKAYPSVLDIEESVDLAIITVPAPSSRSRRSKSAGARASAGWS